MIPILSGEGLVWVVAPWQLTARFLVDQVRRYPDMRAKIRITTMESLRHFIHREAENAVARKAAFELRETKPEMSAGAPRSRTPLAWFAGGMAIVAALSALQSSFTLALDIAFALIFLGWSGLRVLAILLSSQEWPRLPPRNPDTLPIYSIIVAIYNDAESVPALAEALMRLDYPKERLDIKIVVERWDMRTRFALDLMNLKAPFEVVIAPSLGPRTKPKALNAALPFVRGRYVAVYDAE
ncbi:MAG: glycosyl transferase, partial [Pseudorhodoplanes sp.]